MQSGSFHMARIFWLLAAGLFLSSPFSTAQAQSSAPSVCPDNFSAFADGTEPLTCTCDADAAGRGSVWGMDVYTADSSLCRSAVHAGAISRRGGTVTAVPEAGRAAYPGVTRNGISSSNYGTYRSSFRFARSDAAAATPAPAPAKEQAPAAATQATGACPDNFTAFGDSNETLTCTCDAAAVGRGSVWGMDVYTADSSICRSALHAGMVPRNGGQVSVVPEAGRSAYPGVTRNGISSSNYGSYGSSFRFAGEARAAAPSTAATITICPDNFGAFADSGETLACSCDATAVGRGSVWGMDVYTGDSSVCRAALHAGMVTRNGGQVSVVPEAGRNAYPGVTRNGVASNNYGTYGSSFRFAGDPVVRAAAVRAPTAAPVQQNITAGLRERGQVDLYIQFRLNSAELELSAAASLQELANVLNGDPAMRLSLIGHTDSTGSPQHNLNLSLRRAESVRSWLMSQGISPGRVQVDGRGPNEPIADNATEFGRAANRRVQAVRM